VHKLQLLLASNQAKEARFKPETHP